MGEIELEMRGLPRDGVVVTTMQGVAKHAAKTGRRALLHGRDWSDWRDLRDRWSELSRRVGIAHAIGPEWLCDAVTHFCHITHMNQETSIRRARRWAEHYIRNVMLLSEVPHAMREGIAAGRPAIIVGAGPSLDVNARLVPFNSDPITIAVNAASLAVSCDVTLSVESNDIEQKLSSRGMQVFGLASPPSLLQNRKRTLRPVWNGELAWVAEELTGIERLPTSASGSTTAIALAHLWGCNPIVLIGQDLAYTGGRVYANATGFGGDRVNTDGVFAWNDSKRIPRPGNPLHESDQLEMVPAWGGGMVASGVAFRAIRFWLAAAAETFSDTVCINATEGGASIPGWREERFADVLANFDPIRRDKLEFGAPQLERKRILDWLKTQASRELAEVWAYGPIQGRVREHRSREPHWMPAVEAWHVHGAIRDVDAIVRKAEREIRCLVDTF